MTGMKRRMRILCWILAIVCLGNVCAAAEVYDGALPANADEAQLIWTYRAGTDYKNAPTIPVYFDGKVYFMHDRTLTCVDASDGKLVAECALSGRNQYTQVPVLCTDTMVYCPMDGGKVQAVSRRDMRAAWMFTDPLGGQGLSQIVTDGERLYTGFWNDDEETADYVCLDARTGDCLWTIPRTGGYYRTFCAVTSGRVILGGEDGSAKMGTGNLLCVDKRTGEVLDALGGISGDLRSGIAADGNSFYFATKGAMLYKVTLTDDKLTLAGRLPLHGDCTATPIVYGGKVYVSAMSGRFRGEVLVADAQTLAVEKTVPIRQYPQGDALLCTAQSMRLYTTYNSAPGGLVVVDLQTGTSADLFEPDEGMRNYCTSSVQATPDGMLLYKNDSGTIFAVGKKPEKPLTFWQRLVKRVRDFFQKFFSFFKGTRK